MEEYPKIKANATLKEINEWASSIQRIREKDVSEFNNLPKIFMSGRKVGKIPTSSADVSADDRVGDFNYSASYFYILVDNSGATWRRIALGSW